jgi:hypothetical protein
MAHAKVRSHTRGHWQSLGMCELDLRGHRHHSVCTVAAVVAAVQKSAAADCAAQGR